MEARRRLQKLSDDVARYAQGLFPALDRKEAVKALRAEQSFHEFMRQAWPHVEASSFIDGEHIRQICLHQQAFSDGWIRNLAMCIPPQYCKSSTTSVFFPAWEWLRHPRPDSLCVGARERYLTLSYREDLALRDNWRARTLMQSRWYQERWGRRWKFAGDQNVKKRYANSLGGQRVASSMTSAVGQGGTRIVVDDPQSYEEALNRDASDKVIKAYEGNLSMRSFGDRTRKMIIMQRLSFHDLMEYLMKLSKKGLEDWVFLILPIVFTPENVWKTYLEVDPLTGKKSIHNDPGPNRTLFGGDWRTEAGQPLWPELYGGEKEAIAALAKIREKTPDDVWSAQGLQNPLPPGGGPYRNEDYFPTYSRLPTEEEMGPYFLYTTWDCAVKDKETNDPTVGYLVAYYPQTGCHFVLERWHFRQQFVGQENILQSAARKVLSRGAFHVVEGGGNGSALVSALNRWMDEELERTGVSRESDDPEEDPINRFYEWMPRGLSKMGRATICSPRFREKRVFFPVWAKKKNGWYDEVVKTFLRFPYDEHDDDVDALNQGIIWVETEGLTLWLKTQGEYQLGRPDIEDSTERYDDIFPDLAGHSGANVREMVGLWTPWGDL